jgi:hypothetical protein
MGRRYFYHMTNGKSLIVDRDGKRSSSKLQAKVEAICHAERMMQQSPPGIDWSGWQVSIHDKNGHAVANLPFPTSHA